MRLVVFLVALAVLVLIVRSRSAAEVWHTAADLPEGP